jgi:hypothetical protein
MEFINPADVKTVKKAREHLVTLQQRILDAENLLDDLARCVEIASISRQFQLTDVFVEQSMEFLKDRLVLPEIEQGPMKIRVIEGELDQQVMDAIKDANSPLVDPKKVLSSNTETVIKVKKSKNA